MNAKQQVLGRLRQSLNGAPASAVAVPRDYRRSGDHPAGDPSLLDLLEERLVDYRAEVFRTNAGGVAETVVHAVRAGTQNPGRLVVPPGLPSEWLPAAGPGEAVTEIVGDDGLSAEELDSMAGVITGAAVAIAETGTIVLDGSPDQGRRAITLVPDLHVCVVTHDRVVASVPEGLARLHATRPQTWISGPSATSDIELERVEGVHGPRTLHVVLVGPRT